MFKVKKDSWHYKWLTWYTYVNNFDEIEVMRRWDNYGQAKSHEEAAVIVWKHYTLPRDFCSYWRAAIAWPALRLGLNLLAWVPFAAAVIVSGLSGATGLGIVLGALACLFGVIILLHFLNEYFRDVRRETKAKDVVDSDSLIATKYSAWKDKHCPLVEYLE